MSNKGVFLLVILVFIGFSAHTIAAESNPPPTIVKWSAEELTQAVAVKNLSKTKEASFHFVRLKGAESPHIHDRHDLTVFTFSGTSVLHFKDRTVSLKPGDLINIPRGVWHWAENIGQDATLAYAVFTPPYDGKDRRVVNDP